MRRAASALGYLLGWRIVRVLPERWARWLFTVLADLVHRRDGRGVRTLRGNLAVASPGLTEPDLAELTRAAVRSYLRYWCECFRLPAWDLDDVVRRTRTVNEHLVRDAHARGGFVVPLPHMGNWDWAGAWTCGTGMPLLTVAERLRPDWLYDSFVSHRRSLGMEVLALTDDTRTFRRLLEWVRGGGVVCLLADRDMSRHGVEVTLCGHPARLPSGPAVLARTTGAPLIPVTMHYEGADMVMTFHGPVPHVKGPDGLRTMMQGVADAFSHGITAHPVDWHMMQPVFAGEPTRSGR